MTVTLTDLFVIASILQGLFVGLAILRIPFFRSPANQYLGMTLILLSGILFLGWQEFDSKVLAYLWSIMWEYLHIAMLISYFLRALEHPFYNSPWRKWFYAPFVFSLVFSLVTQGDFMLGLYDLPFGPDNAVFQTLNALEDPLALIFNGFGLLAVFVITWRDRSAPAARRRWLLRFCAATLGIVFLWALGDLTDYSGLLDNAYTPVWVALSILFWWVAYAGVYKMRILDEQRELHAILAGTRVGAAAQPNPMAASTGSVPKEPASTATPNEKYTYELRRLMEEEKLFRDPDLSRAVVAEKLGISESYVSQVMTAGVGESFSEYVTRYRIEDATDLLSRPAFDRYSLEAIGLEAGFKSRSAFYGAFKKATGTTPGASRKARKTS
ncbi:AraC family transcriptional regulator [Lewinella sp. 4G2]|uniref:helix-turn-helix domain-containing protein n=1 Tax=Lewinella sp. 4G2 TaxID=1803372 RepID=UPI0007B49F3F|nr:helix-turn-helix transcriptional regulator [Lewinella sp. 4G2]OAV43151.1 hypothetical protein A3850_000970 [Lewinella sp. 4G2]